MLRRGRATGVVLVAVLALAGCGSGDAPPGEDASSTASPTGSTGSTGPVPSGSGSSESGPGGDPSSGTGTPTLLGPPVVPGGGQSSVAYPGGEQVTWRANRDGLPWSGPGQVVEQAAPPALVAAVRAHLDSRSVGAAVAEATRSASGRVATRELRWRWAGEGERVGLVAVLVSRGLLEPEVRPDACSSWPAPTGVVATTRCRVLRSAAGTVVVGDVRRAGVGGDVRERVAFTVREDGVVVSARAATQTDQVGEVGAAPPQLPEPPLDDRELAALVLDPAVTVAVGPATAA